MTPKKRLDKGKAPMIEEEPRRLRTRSRGTTLVISELVDGPVPRSEEAQTMTSEAASIMPAKDIRESGRIEISDRREVSRTTNVSGQDDRMYAMLERMTNTMDEVRNFTERQTRVERSPPRAQMRQPRDMPREGPFLPIEPRPEPVRLDMKAFTDMKSPVYQGEEDYQIIDKWVSQMEKLFAYMQCTEE
ncbi:hypothetical protein ACLOJK_006719 [Asimina triloba]